MTFLTPLSYWLAAIITFSQQYDALNQEQSPNMVLIKGGAFIMGDANGEGDERPVHEVTLGDFYMNKYELTVAEYRKFCSETGRDMPKEPEWGWIDNHPIINTSWYDAEAYINWINQKTGKSYRLPTEAEMAYVIRNGGEDGTYPWGEGTPKENIADESYKKSTGRTNIWKGYDDGYEATSPVGSFVSNKLGIYDINGNMWEWVSDWYGDYSNSSVTNPKGPSKGTHKVGKGASYNADPWHVRSAGRNWVEPEFEGPTFRLVLDIE